MKKIKTKKMIKVLEKRVAWSGKRNWGWRGWGGSPKMGTDTPTWGCIRG